LVYEDNKGGIYFCAVSVECCCDMSFIICTGCSGIAIVELLFFKTMVYIFIRQYFCKQLNIRKACCMREHA
ncbi:hypothetical protein LE117_14255, partial [Escherichia coli]|nr:hypothetical protein [Escherichia coli]